MRICMFIFTLMFPLACAAYERDVTFGAWSVYCESGSVYTNQRYNKNNFVNIAIFSDDSAAITITRNYRVRNKDFSSVSINGRFIKLNNVRVINFDRGNSNDRVFNINGVVFKESAITPEYLALFPNAENEFIHRASFATELGVKNMRWQLSNDSYKYVHFDEIKVSSDGFKKAWNYMLSCKPL
ncbi:MAG: hypothetical protein ACRCYC_10515 [Paraclostridium sp.]|uniref:hypothetical protein n=1 Tax=Paraclostridium sp. TaxID=2023273 RepID=UPI003F3D0C02